MAAKLDQDTFNQLVLNLQAGARNWKFAIEGFAETIEPGQDKVLASQFLDMLTDTLLPTYKEKNDKAIVELFNVLGLMFIYEGDGIDSVIDERVFEHGWHTTARTLARNNLTHMLTNNTEFANTYTREMISIGWRDTYLIALAQAAKDDGEGFISRIISKGYSNSESTAKLRPEMIARMTKIRETLGSMEDTTEWVVKQLDHQFWWTLLSNSKKAAKEGPVEGAVLFVEELEKRLAKS